MVLARLAYREENKMIDTFDPMTQRKEHRGCVFDADTVKRFILLGGDFDVPACRIPNKSATFNL